MTRELCIHGHFYQPPRENPWLEAIEQQDSAYPYHDWNERITDECYRPNGRSRILDDERRIVRIVNNYARMSFNFGPTVLSWMQVHEPDVHRAIIEADQRSRERFGGHGSAMAQAYNHMILPLANERDQHTQVIWGIRDFEHRFGRAPEGMWLAETAANTATLEALAAHGIRYTVLAPRQAARTRPRRGGRWGNVHGAIDPSRAYECRLPSGRRIALFFYDGPISQAVAFEGLLDSGETFAGRLLSGFSDARTWPQLMHIATDGETYGHHHRHGDMALAYAIEHIESMHDVRLTNYGEFLERHPPTHLVQIVEDSSWSCVHGVGRWMTDCGCHTGGNDGWNQGWREPLRQALDWLRDELAPRYEARAAELLNDPWAARDAYIDVVLDRSRGNVEDFLSRHARRPLGGDEPSTALKLLELQRHAMLMYTSCGWFFDELSGIETVQVIQYAGRAIQLAGELFDGDVESGFLDRVELARSNLEAQGNGRDIYERSVRPKMVDLQKVGAHVAVQSLFEAPRDRHVTYCFDVDTIDERRLRSGRAALHVGRARIASQITWEAEELSYAVLHLGDHQINGAVRPYSGAESFQTLVDTLTGHFERADFVEVLRSLDALLGAAPYSLGSLFRDEQRAIVRSLLASTMSEVEAVYSTLYHQHAPLCRYMADLGITVPRALRAPAEFVLDAAFRASLAEDPPDTARLRQLLDEARAQSVRFDEVTLGFVAEHAMRRLARALREAPQDIEHVDRLLGLTEVVGELPFSVDLSEVQNIYYEVLHDIRPGVAARDDESAATWLERFDALGHRLRVKIDAAAAEIVPVGS